MTGGDVLEFESKSWTFDIELLVNGSIHHGTAILTWTSNVDTLSFPIECVVELPRFDRENMKELLKTPVRLMSKCGQLNPTVGRVGAGKFQPNDAKVKFISDRFHIGSTETVASARIYIRDCMRIPECSFDVADYHIKLVNDTNFKQLHEFHISKVSGQTLTIDEILLIATCLSDMISIAQGCTTEWSRIDGDGPYSKWTLLNLAFFDCPRGPIMRPVIDLHDERIFVLFVQQTWKALSQMDDTDRGLWRKFHDYIIMATNSPYPSPFLLLYSAVEFLTKRDVGLSEELKWYKPMSGDERKELGRELKEWLSRKGIQIDDSDIGNKTDALLQTNFKPRAQALFDKYNVYISNDLLNEFNQRRNSTHKGYEPKDGDYSAWSRFAGCMEQVILNRLGYSGPFLDNANPI